MANRTVTDAKSVKGTNPQYLVEKIVRTRIYESKYWKEQCFALSAELLVDKAMSLEYIGGTFGGNIKPTPFLCLILKMLQIQPEKEIVVEFIKNDDYKYVRALGAMYMRLVGTSLDVYNYLEPLLNDYRKLKVKNKMGVLELTHIDEFIDELLREDRVCDVILPRIQKRHLLESSNQIEPRRSALEDDLDDLESEDDEEEEEEKMSPRHHRSPSPDRHRRRRHSPRSRRSHSRSPRRRSRSPRRRSASSRRHRHRSRSPARRHHSPSRRHRRRSQSRSPSPHKSKKSGRREGKSEASQESMEIEEANALRAKLGLKPLKP